MVAEHRYTGDVALLECVEGESVAILDSLGYCSLLLACEGVLFADEVALVGGVVWDTGAEKTNAEEDGSNAYDKGPCEDECRLEVGGLGTIADKAVCHEKCDADYDYYYGCNDAFAMLYDNAIRRGIDCLVKIFDIHFYMFYSVSYSVSAILWRRAACHRFASQTQLTEHIETGLHTAEVAPKSTQEESNGIIGDCDTPLHNRVLGCAMVILTRQTGRGGARWHNKCRGALGIDVVTMATLELLLKVILHLARVMSLASERVSLGYECHQEGYCYGQ